MRWRLRPLSASQADTLQKELGIHSIVAAVLSARKTQTPEEAREFLNPSLATAWSDPRAIEGIDAVADKLEAALRQNKRICIFGDYDVDGMTASAIMYNTLKALGTESSVILPLREGEGYGLTEPALERMYACKPDLVLTVDCGVSGAHEVALLKARGIEVIITDHHESSGAIPEGVALADPKLDPESPQAILAGAGVALKLSAELGARFGMPELWKEHLDLVTLGTVADCMPLVKENRALVAEGLKAINTDTRTSIKAMLEVVGKADSEVSSQTLSFSLIPRLNAAGRVSDPLISFDLLSTHDPLKAERLALKLEELNSERKDLENLVYEQAKKQIDPTQTDIRSIVVGGEGWHHGVKGIVASRLAREYGVPAIVFSYEDGLASGSGRSVGEIDLHAAVSELSELLVKFGGHQAAIGVTIKQDAVTEFSRKLELIMQGYPAEVFQSAGEIDCLLDLEQLSIEAVEELQVLEPYGTENPEPVFITHDVLIKSARFVGTGTQHMSFIVSNGSRELSAIWFNTPYNGLEELPVQADIVYTAHVDEWRGHRKVKLQILDVVESKSGELPNLEHSTEADALIREHLLHSGEHELLNAHLAQVLTGQDVTLRASQSKCLKDLHEAKSTLGIMATGRGKSLIFHVHAAKLALQKQQPSLFIYPLRSLINDQEYALARSMARLGISCASLTGATSKPERERIARDIANGSLSVILTTPEFVLANARNYSFWDSFAFVVIDEAHHIATSSEGFRPDYTNLQRLRALIPQAVFLGLSATSDQATTDAIVASLGIKSIVVDTSKRPNLTLDDRRGITERSEALTEIVAQSTKSLVYVSSRGQSIELCKDLRKTLRDKAPSIGFYNAALTAEDRSIVERAFREGELTCIVATSAFGEGVNIPDVRDVVLYDLPYSLIDFNQMAGRAGRDGKEAHIHLLAHPSELEQRSVYLTGDEDITPSDGADGLEGDETVKLERHVSLRQLQLFSDWLFATSSHELLSVIQRPLTPLEA